MSNIVRDGTGHTHDGTSYVRCTERMDGNGNGKRGKEEISETKGKQAKGEVEPSEGKKEAQGSAGDIGEFGEYTYGWKEWIEEGSEDEEMWMGDEEPTHRDIYIRVKDLTRQLIGVLQKTKEERTVEEDNLCRAYRDLGGLARHRRIRYLQAKAWRLYKEYEKTVADHDRLNNIWKEDLERQLEQEERALGGKRRWSDE